MKMECWSSASFSEGGVALFPGLFFTNVVMAREKFFPLAVILAKNWPGDEAKGGVGQLSDDI